MNTKRSVLAVFVIAVAILGISLNVRAQNEIAVIISGNAKPALDQLIPAFEHKTGYKVKITYTSAAAARKQAIQGDEFDVPILQPPYADVIASGNVVTASETPLAVVPVAIAVRKGAPKPDISTPEAFKKTLLNAKGITYPEVSSGAGAAISFDEAIKKLGIADQVRAKLTLPKPGSPGGFALVANGEAELAVRFISEMHEPDLGIDVVGPLPRQLSTPIGLVGFVSTHAKDPTAAKALLSFLSSPEAAAVYKSLGMQPGK
jgi:molybdate transport system substrate-binding protein